MQKIVTLQLTVRVDASVGDNEVAQQIGDALDPDSWNWDVSYPDAVASRPAPEDDDEDDEPGPEPDSEDDPGREARWARNATVIRRFLDNPGPPLTG